VLARLRPHLTNSANFSKRQSAYRQGHTTETALVDVLESVYTAADNKEVTVLIGLDLSAAFDTFCHSILTQRLQTEFGVSGTAISWISRICTVGRSTLRWDSIGHLKPRWKSEYPKARYSDRCCSPSTAARWLTSSRLTASDTTSTPTTHSFT